MNLEKRQVRRGRVVGMGGRYESGDSQNALYTCMKLSAKYF